ncbi:MAG: hypothetical protein ABIF89_02775 [bacterium]
MTMTTQSITSGQEKQVKRIIEDAVGRAFREGSFDKERVQRLIENGREFQVCIIDAMRRLSAIDQSGDKDMVESSYAYPEGYMIKGIAEQIETLRRFFPGIICPAKTLVSRSMSFRLANTEGWFAIPRWQKVATTYGKAVEIVLGLVNRQRDGKLYKPRRDVLEELHLQQHERTMRMLETLGYQQMDCDILIVAAQFGFRHRGRSVLRAREDFAANEFGLGAFEVGCMLLTHPERFVSPDDLGIDCAGDECIRVFDAPASTFFRLGKNGIVFDASWFICADPRYGSASGFLDEVKL